MNLLRKPAAVAVAALALAALPAVAEAHDGTHPFKNCTDAYDAGYSDIEKGDEHYGEHLDRDKDGVGCDKPPADFVPADDKGTDAGEDTDSDTGTGTDTDKAGGQAAGKQGTDLAETGGDDNTPYLAAGGAAVALAGGGLLLAARRRRDAGTR
ncbi:excalibur calcium-binding domain-containing protein [Streptomyces sp. CL12-4]|uniref:excalibur calcium-binding domain-containing protein n=1 Tax=Streptomyces sp. CL12-4 TaxID=2810306 RepID=UPI001EFB2C25|nr:excalibur calcium-binding domain-containing protein [Streptomyces sp. CL12-4]MCG8968404.1 excalibur calcium-binding domain-containing protein [Streptomyces sp. CL12-4]